MISLIHPSRGRPEKARRTFERWWGDYMRGHQFDYTLSLDMDDPKLKEYEKEFEGIWPGPIIADNRSVVDATNIAAQNSKGDILVYLSDDFNCPDKWVELIESEFAKYSGPTLIKVDDCLQKFHVPVLTIPIMNRELYKRLGYFWHPSYKSMFVDEDLYWTAKKLGALAMAPHLKFPHEHVSIGKAENDETYMRSAKNWDTGKHLFAHRKAMNFPL